MPFIVFEGLDACGKSTQIQMLADRLQSFGIDYLLTREPGGTPLGEDLRSLLLRTDGQAPVPRSEVLIYMASRAQLVDTVIRPALARGQWVLCDRYTASSVAFQAGGRKLPRTQIDWLNDYATDCLVPDLTIFVDISVAESEKRRHLREQKSGLAQDRFEKEKRAFHQAIFDSYQDQFRAGSNWIRVDGEQTPEQVFAVIWQAIKGKSWHAF